LDALPLHYEAVTIALADGTLVPFLGAGFNLCDRPNGVSWNASQSLYLPSGSELSTYLANHFACPPESASNLAYVAQWIETLLGSGHLYERLRPVFGRNYPITTAHEFLARIARVARTTGADRVRIGPQVIVTANYDELLENAFTKAQEPFHLLTYVTEGSRQGKFLHRTPEGTQHFVEIPNQYDGISTGTVILKLHGALSATPSDDESVVITEDHYIDYLSRAPLSTLIPATVLAVLRRCNFLFLGYSLRDWNLRVILHQLSKERSKTYQSWAIQKEAHPIDQKYWLMRGVELLQIDLHTYMSGFDAALQRTGMDL
jgi:hypothetical protein